MDSRAKILSAFCECLSSKPFSALSVCEICQNARVSKKTFYNHFETKDDLIKALLDDDFFSSFREIRKNFYDEQLRSFDAHLCENTFRILKDNWPIYQNIVCSIGKLEFFNLFAKGSTQLNKEIYLPNEESGDIDHDELDFMCGFLSEASAYSLRWWVDRGFTPSTSVMAEYYVRWTLSYVNNTTLYKELCALTAKK